MTPRAPRTRAERLDRLDRLACALCVGLGTPIVGVVTVLGLWYA